MSTWELLQSGFGVLMDPYTIVASRDLAAEPDP